MRIFFDVDTQNDFMNKDGKLYVPGAHHLIEKIRGLTNLAMKYNIQILGSVDVHFGDEEHASVEGELQRNCGPFPDHCMIDTEGSKKINIDLMPDKQFIAGWRTTQKPGTWVKTEGVPTFFEKQTYDVFTNPFLEPTLKNMGVTEAYVYGVATDYCVKAAVLGLRKMAIPVYLVDDAVAGVDPTTVALAETRMHTAGQLHTSVARLTAEMDSIYGPW